MPDVRPFAALRPRPELAPRICELPYDVFSTEEARRRAVSNPLSFLHVSKPEIDLPEGTDPYSPQVYARGRENLRRLRAQGALVLDTNPAYYLYRQTLGTHAQTGIVGVASCRDYFDGVIRKHELTRVDKENDRVRHIETLEAQTGPAFLVYRAVPQLDRWVHERTQSPPDIDFEADDGIRHTTWTVGDAADVAFIQTQFAAIPRLYIADGHHRTAAAARVHQTHPTQPGASHFLAVIFPHNSLQILPYHRVIHDLNGLHQEDFLRRLAAVADLEPSGKANPARKHEFALYLGARWYTLRLRPATLTGANPVDSLDVALLQQHVLAPILGIQDPRTDQRIDFVGGIRGTGELERLVDQDDCGCAFSLYPTSIDDLMTIADTGGIMPPKSTWFEPKLRDALFSHLLASHRDPRH